MTKKLFVLIKNLGDGSSAAVYTFNEAWVLKLKDMCNAGTYYEDLDWVNGDGFHYDTLTVPDECTLESLGIHYDAADNV